MTNQSFQVAKAKQHPDKYPVVVIGSSGFVGKVLVRTLLMQGDIQVRTLQRNPIGEYQHPNLTTIQGDLSKIETLKNLLVENCIVINLAYDFTASSKANLLATENLAQICKLAKIKRLIHCSTASVYGRNPDNLINEDSTCYPGTEYSATKLCIEEILFNASSGNFEFVNLRPTSIFGPNGLALLKLITNLTDGSMVLNYFRSCLFNKRKLNLVSVETVIAAITFLMERDLDVNRQTFIIAEDDEPINNFQYVEKYLMEKIVGRYYFIRPINIPLFVLSWLLKLRNRDAYNPLKVYDSKRIVNLGFNPPKNLQQSLDSFVEWHLNQIAHNQEK